MVDNETEAAKVTSDYIKSCIEISLLKMESECSVALIKKRECDSRETEANVVAARVSIL